MSVCWSGLKREWLASYREWWTCCEFEYNESIFKVVCVSLHKLMPVCFRKWLITCICARTVTQHPTQPSEEPEQHLLFPLALIGPVFFYSCLWISCSLLLSFLASVFFLSDLFSSSFLLFPHEILFHPYFLDISLNPLSKRPLLQSLRGLCFSFITGGVKPLRHFPPLSSGSCKVTLASIVAPMLRSVALYARLQSAALFR